MTFKGKPDLKHDLHEIFINRDTNIEVNYHIGLNVIVAIRNDGLLSGGYI